MVGGGKKKETTTQDTTQTVQLPAWMTAAGQGLYGDAKAAADANPIQAYNQSLSAGIDPNQRKASVMAAQGAGAGQGDLGVARMLTGRAATAEAPRVGVESFDGAQAQRYMSPYVQQVQDNTMREMGRRNEMERASLGDSAQGSKSYGGDRHAILEGEMRRGQNQNMIDYLAQSNAAAFSDAQAQFERDRSASLQTQMANAGYDMAGYDRMMQGGAQAGQLGQIASGLNTEAINNLSRTGGVEQALGQDTIDRDYQEFLRMQDAPMDRYRDLMGILTGAPRNVTTAGTMNGKTVQTTGGGLLNSLLGGAQIAAGIFSERRLKKDIERVGELPSGLGLYRYRYLWDADDAETRVGVMADEVAEIMPEALGPVAFGYQTVDYSMIGGW